MIKMKQRVENLPQKKLIVQSKKMSIAENSTFNLWNSFLKRMGEIQNKIASDLYSVQIYQSDFLRNLVRRNSS